MTSPIVTPVTPRRTVPYISPDMFKFHARRGVDLTSLAPAGAPPAAQDQALAQYIESASSWMDDHAEVNTLAASADTELKRVNVNRYGAVTISPRNRPVLAVTALAFGATANRLAPLTDLSAIAVTPNSFQASAWTNTLTMSSAGPLQFGAAVGAPADQVWAQYTTIGGFPITYLTAAVTAGATQISVADVTGIIPGQTWLVVQSGSSRFRFLAGSVTPSAGASGVLIGTGGAGTVGCAAVPWNIPNNSAFPTMVTALTGSLIECAVLVTRGMIKQRGGGNITSVSPKGSRTQPTDRGAADDFAEAWEILQRNISVRE